MITVICAMSEERDALLKLMSDVKEYKHREYNYHGTILDNEYHIGKIGNNEVALFHSGVGKVYSTITTLEAINLTKPELVINLGCAGSTNKDVHVNDVVIATRVAHWDVDIPTWDRSMISDKISYACGGKCLKIAKSIKTNTNIHFGYITSSDSFVYKKSQTKVILKYFPDSLCTEMEGASIANTCYACGVNFSIIRSISDETLISGDNKNFDFNLLRVCDTAANICKQIIEKY